jgi:predicted membrane GTPase involved in stress response
MFAYGSPNFGENPETDRKEPYMMLTGFPAVVLVEADGTVSDPIAHVQLVFDDKHDVAKQKAAELLRKGLAQISGTIFAASTGHHHEPAILIVDDVKDSGSRHK